MSLGSFMVAGCLMVVGCAESTPFPPTPYQPYNPTASPEHPAGGYLTTPLTRDVYLITFRGNVRTLQENVEAYAYRRAAEVCGRDNFDVLSDDDASKVEEQSETSGRAFGSGAFASFSASTSTTQLVWPRRRLKVRCRELPAPTPPVSTAP
jgi:hypothetical protein